jgi:hypothetical protein
VEQGYEAARLVALIPVEIEMVLEVAEPGLG